MQELEKQYLKENVFHCVDYGKFFIMEIICYF